MVDCPGVRHINNNLSWSLTSFLGKFLCRHIEEGIISEEFHRSFCCMEWWLKSCSSCVLFSSRTPVDGPYDGLLGFQEASMIGFDFENSGRSIHIIKWHHIDGVEWLGKKDIEMVYIFCSCVSFDKNAAFWGNSPLDSIHFGEDMIPFGDSNERLNHQLRYGPKNTKYRFFSHHNSTVPDLRKNKLQLLQVSMMILSPSWNVA